MARKKRGPSAAKAAQMLHEDRAQGKPLTRQQQKFFGALARGQKPRGRRGRRRDRA